MKTVNDDDLNESILDQSSSESFCFIVSILICLVITVLFVVPYFAGFFKHNEIVLTDKINPNNAPAASLLRLPGVGVVRAEAIVVYRKEFVTTNGEPAFENYKDLEKVKGIGPKTAQKVCEWLKFE